jgi:DNA ligase-1
MIQSWCSANNFKHVEALSWENVDLSTTKGKDRFSEINKQAVAGGYEGIMIKDIDASYQCKRSHAWLKMKPFIEVTLKVVDIEEGTGRNAGRVGALICHGIDDGKEIEVNVGSGLTDAMRDDIWQCYSSLIGDLVEVRADAITKNQDSETYSLRFPRFKEFRSWSEESEEKL